MPKIVVLWTDAVVWALVVALVLYVRHVRRDPGLAASWRRVLADAPALCSAVVLGIGLVVTVVDSVHFRARLAATTPGEAAAWDTRTQSLLDVALARLVHTREASYSRPLAFEGFTRESVEEQGQVQRRAPRLQHGGAHLRDPALQWTADVAWRAAAGAVLGIAASVLALLALAAAIARRPRCTVREAAGRVLRGQTELPWRAAWVTLSVALVLAGAAAVLAQGYHVLGTDRTGNDVLYQSLKSVRTAFVIGTLASLATLPLALVLGLVAGWFRGWVDEAVQYGITLLSSVPNVLLIAACVLMVQVFLDQNAEAFATGAERADVKLFVLCLILGLTGWTGLARLVRAEVLKLRELEFVQAATAFGQGPVRIMARHLAPNVMHLVLITTVLDFCALILYEAVLSYVGVGVDPSMNSFGGMINLARSEMSRDPVVWWSFASAFAFMVAIVLAANLFADGVREAFDPRSRGFRPRRAARAAGKG